jgi:hypothetical protein
VIETRGERDSLVLLPLDKIGNVDGDPLVPSLEAAVALRRLVDELRRRASRLIRCRQRVVTASIDSLPDGALSRPLALAEAILEALAPYVRELRERSVQANDLTLVHESETGQRTRFSLRADVMRAKVAQLPEEYRTTFASYGYGLRAGDDDDAVTQRLTRIDFERLRARLFGNSAVAA